MRINIVTIFPTFFEAPLSLSIPGRAAAAGLVAYRVVDLRDHAHDRHRTVDDYPYGGGTGMVMKPEPFFEAVEALAPDGPVVLLSARGRGSSTGMRSGWRFSRISHYCAGTTRMWTSG
jgi:tRNA (guanine37-N1)-methyltransferase